VPWIGIKDATQNHGRVIEDTLQHASELGIENSSARLLPENTVCLSRTASVGYVVVMGRSMATSQDFVNWVCSQGIDWRFLKHVLLAETEAFIRFAHGTTHQTIYFPEVKAFHVALPGIDEQRAISAVLGALDDKIESDRRLVAAQRQMRSLRFANLRRIGFDRVPLEAIADHLKGTIQPTTTPDEAFEQFSIPAFDATGDPEVCLGWTMASGKTPLPSEAVVLISKLNPRIPRVWAPVPSGVGRPVCSPEFLVLRPKPHISHAWLDACVRHDKRFYNDLLAGVTGTTGSRQRVKPADVMTATVPDATAEEISEWTAFASPMIDREAVLDRERRTLTAIRDALLPKLVSGQVRVPLSGDPEEQFGVAAGT